MLGVEGVLEFQSDKTQPAAPHLAKWDKIDQSPVFIFC